MSNQTQYLGLYLNGPLGSTPETTETGARTQAMQTDLNFETLDSVIEAIISGGGTSVEVNGTKVTNPNFNDSTPAAPVGYTDVKWQIDGSGHVSAYAVAVAEQVNSDWNAVSGVAQILNKPALASVATTGAYSSLSGTPSSLPPSGSAGGDLSGTYPSPTVAKISGGSIPKSSTAVGTDSDGKLVDASSSILPATGGTLTGDLTLGLASYSLPPTSNSHSFVFAGEYYTGSSYAKDTWTIQSILGPYTNDTSILTFSHSGTSGLAAVEVPSPLLIGGTDTGLSRGSSGMIYIGDGTSGSYIGGLQCSVINMFGAGNQMTLGLADYTAQQLNSPGLLIAGSYGSGPFSKDQWLIQDFTDATSGTLTITHSGTATAKISLPVVPTLPSQSQSYIFAAPSGSSGAPSFRAMAVADLPTSGSWAFAGTFSSNVTFSNVPTFPNEAQYSVFAAPSSGAGAPSFRALVVGDIPSLSSVYLPLSGGGVITNGDVSVLSAAGQYFVLGLTDYTIYATSSGILELAGSTGAGVGGTNAKDYWTIQDVVSAGTTSTLTFAHSGALTTVTAISMPVVPTLPSQTQHYVFAAPSGSSGAPSFRALVASDVPSLPASQITSGALALARGGTGVDLSATGGATYVLAQDASHVISARALLAADIPSLSYLPSAGGTLTGSTQLDGATNSFTLGLASYTAAISNSASLVIAGSYENAATPTYAEDSWTLQDVIGAGLNGTSTLTLTHSGTSGAAVVDLSTAASVKATILNAATGFQVNSGATSGHVLRGNGTNFVDAALVAADIPNITESQVTNLTTDLYTNTAAPQYQGVPWDIGCQMAASASSAVPGNTSDVYFFQFELKQKTTFTKLTGYNSIVHTGDVYYVGIYSGDGTAANSLKVQWSYTSTSSTGAVQMTNNVVTLNPGPYTFVWAGSGTVMGFYGLNVAAGWVSVLNKTAGTVKVGYATSGVSGGSLPSALTGKTTISSVVAPFFILEP